MGNGAFTIGNGMDTRKYKDGLSKTAFFSERTKGSGTPSNQLPLKSDMITSPARPDENAINIPVPTLLAGCESYTPSPNQYNFAGAGRWLPGEDWSNGWPFAGYDSTQYNHVAPPNWAHYDCGMTSAISDTPGEHMIVAPRSEHPGAVVVAFGDGHTDLINDSIDLIVWRALGTRDGGETIDTEL